MEKTKFCVWHSSGILCLQMTQHQLQLESWDNWDIVYENLIIKHKSSAGFTFLCKYTALCIEMTCLYSP